MADKILTVYSNRKFDEEVSKEIRRLLNDKDWLKEFIAGKNNPEWTHDNNRKDTQVGEGDGLLSR